MVRRGLGEGGRARAAPCSKQTAKHRSRDQLHPAAHLHGLGHVLEAFQRVDLVAVVAARGERACGGGGGRGACEKACAGAGAMSARLRRPRRQGQVANRAAAIQNSRSHNKQPGRRGAGTGQLIEFKITHHRAVRRRGWRRPPPAAWRRPCASVRPAWGPGSAALQLLRACVARRQWSVVKARCDRLAHRRPVALLLHDVGEELEVERGLAL